MGSSVKNSIDDNTANDICFGSGNSIGNNCVSSGAKVDRSGDLEERLAYLNIQPATTITGLIFS